MIEDLHDRMHRPCFQVVRAVNQPLDTCMHQCSGAHRARFNCSKQFAASKTVVTNGSTGFAQGHDLGMGRGVGVGDIAIPTSSDDASIAHDHGADRNLADFKGALGTTEGFFHPEFIGRDNWRCVVGRSLLVTGH